MSRANFLFTSESVSEGHPDKVSDQISDAILDAFIEKDIKLGIADDSQINTRLGCETLCTTNKIVVAGEGRGQLFRTINGKAVVDREPTWPALAMNAGAFGGETWTHVRALETIDRRGRTHRRAPEEYRVGYREVIAPVPEEWFLAAELSFERRPGGSAAR